MFHKGALSLECLIAKYQGREDSSYYLYHKVPFMHSTRFSPRGNFDSTDMGVYIWKYAHIKSSHRFGWCSGAFIFLYTPWFIASCTCLRVSPNCYEVMNYAAGGQPTELSELNAGASPSPSEWPSVALRLLLSPYFDVLDLEPTILPNLFTDSAILFWKEIG